MIVGIAGVGDGVIDAAAAGGAGNRSGAVPVLRRETEGDAPARGDLPCVLEAPAVGGGGGCGDAAARGRLRGRVEARVPPSPPTFRRQAPARSAAAESPRAKAGPSSPGNATHEYLHHLQAALPALDRIFQELHRRGIARPDGARDPVLKLTDTTGTGRGRTATPTPASDGNTARPCCKPWNLSSGVGGFWQERAPALAGNRSYRADALHRRSLARCRHAAPCPDRSRPGRRRTRRPDAPASLRTGESRQHNKASGRHSLPWRLTRRPLARTPLGGWLQSHRASFRRQ